LTGLSVYLAATMQWIAGFGFSAGLVDMVLSTRNPLAKDWYMLLVQGAAFFAIYYFAFRTAIQVLRLKTLGREDTDTTIAQAPASTMSGSTAELAAGYLEAIGGASNVSNVDACITRLRLTLVDTGKVDTQAAKRLGASGVVTLNQQSVQIIVGPRAELIAASLHDLLLGAPVTPASHIALPVVPHTEQGETVLFAPVTGEVVALQDVPDAAFASKAVGDGLAIRPTQPIVVAPCDGQLANIFNTNHAFAIVSDTGAEIIVHIGVDTVKLRGQGFKRLAQAGTRVKAGDPVLELDLDYLNAHAVSVLSPVVLSNAEEFGALDQLASGTVVAGQSVLFKFKKKST
jgi:PTS system N-acetylglucosamine-specific IIC component